MQLSFEKQANGEVRVRFKQNDMYEEFSYSKMVRKMFDEKIVADPEIIGNFTDKEIASINGLIGEFRGAITESSQKEDDEPLDLTF